MGRAVDGCPETMTARAGLQPPSAEGKEKTCYSGTFDDHEEDSNSNKQNHL